MSKGFLTNLKKSVLQPLQQMKFLGLIIDISQMTISLTEAKVQKVTEHCQELSQNSQAAL